MASPSASGPSESGKRRAVRIPLDYFRESDALTRWKLGLTGLALVLAVGWWASGFVTSDDGRLRYARGPVAAVHATWEANCDSCHASFSPVNGSNWSTPFLGHAHESDGRCQSCHAGAVHHATQKASDTPGCGSCHRDHRGRDASLTRLPDSDCVSCHQKLPAHMDGSTVYHEAITRFDRDHPPFRLDDPEAKKRVPLKEMQKKDPGNLKFNHAIHLTAGMKATWKLSDIQDPAKRERYRQQQQKQANDALVQLTCSSCHVLDRTDLSVKGERAGESSRRGAGDYMVPITYEDHCRACHPLTFDPKSPERTIPHRLQPREVRDFLWGAYAKDALAKKGPDQAAPIRRPMPGTDLTEEEKRLRKEIDDKLTKMETFLHQDKRDLAERTAFLGKQTCGECHLYQSAGQNSAPDQIVPTKVPEVWFQHAVFNHTAHRLVKCEACHTQATESTVSKDILLPDIETCTQCHSPPGHRAGKVQGGARFDCTECHRYHHRDNPLEGIGVAKGGVSQKRDIERFLTPSGNLLKD